MRKLFALKRGVDVIDIGGYRCYSFGTLFKDEGCRWLKYVSSE
jgi:hypothetical protein